MKEEDSNPLEPVGDEPIEARIVAWVLGDASAFEAAELERLCAENPELEVFRRRMLALHGLLGEAGDTAPDDHWKLSPDRRSKVEALFHAPASPAAVTLLKPKRSSQPWIRQALMASAACLVLAAGFRYVFAPAKDAHTRLAVDESVGTMSSRKSSTSFWAGRDLPVAEGYASSKPVLPELRDMDEERLTRSELVPNRPMGGGLSAGGGRGLGLDSGDALADNNERDSAVRSRTKAAAAKPAAAPMGAPASRAARAPSEIPMAAARPPAPAITPAPATPESQPEIASASGARANTDFISPVDGQTIAGVPASDVTKTGNIVTGGLRSGDAAITRNNIDAVLNNPNRVAQSQAGPREDVAGQMFDSEPQAALAKKEEGGVEGELHIGYSSDYIFRDSDASGRPVQPSKEKKGGKESNQLALAGEAIVLNGEQTANFASGGMAAARKDAPKGQIADGGSAADVVWSTPDESAKRDIHRAGAGALSADKPEVIRELNYSTTNQPADTAPKQPVAGDKDFSNLDAMGRLAAADRQTANPSYYSRQGTTDGAEWYGSLENTNTPLAIPDHYAELDVHGEVSKDLGIASTPLPATRFSGFDGFANFGAPIDAPADPLGSTLAKGGDQFQPKRSEPAVAPVAAAPLEAAKANQQANNGLALDAPSNGNTASVETISKALQEQEDKVEEKRKLLTNIVRTKGIILTGKESLYGTAINEDDRGAVSARDMANKLEQEKIQLESQIQTLLKSNSDQLLSYASGLNLPENVVKTLYPQYLEQQRAVSKLKEEGLADSHPRVAAQKQALATMQRQLDEETASLKETLRAQLALAEGNLAKLKVLGDEKTGEALERSIDSTDYLKAKSELENAQNKLKELKQQLAITKAATPASPKPAPVPTDETVAAAEPFSTFSLHVSDASFKLAKAALDRGERLSADQIRPEEFYNAFDYGDPAPAPGEPVACTIEQAAHPVLPQRNIVRVAMRVGSAGRNQGQPLNLTLLLDNSGSMEREDRHEGLKAAITQLASLLQAGDTVTLAGFSRTPHLLADRLSGAEAGKLVELVDKLPSEGGTNLEEALKLAGELAVQRKNPAAQNRIVLLTDGAANLGNAQPDDLANKVAALRQQGIAFDAAGIGAGGLNDRMLEALTRHGNGRYYIVNDPKDADANFAKQLAGAFRPAAENVKVQVHFNPNRVSRYKLIGFEKHRLNTEDFHNDAVDAAELAADEAGVALYQVETIPDGSGEIGEVSVRFRDTAAGRMVENTWTIPHDEKTPAFDQARPSIQLATLSMLAAEKLRGGPLAEATDFTTLSPVISRVKNYYSTSSRVGDLTGMTGKLR